MIFHTIYLLPVAVMHLSWNHSTICPTGVGTKPTLVELLPCSVGKTVNLY